MVTRQEIERLASKIAETQQIIDELIKILSTALFSYTVKGVTKTISEQDLQGLIEDYQAKKLELINKLKELP